MLISDAIGGTDSLPLSSEAGEIEAAEACWTLLEAAGFLLALVGFLKALNEDIVLVLLQDVTFVVVVRLFELFCCVAWLEEAVEAAIVETRFV